MRRRRRLKRLKKHLVYMPAAGAVAFGSMMGLGKSPKLKIQEKTETSVRLNESPIRLHRPETKDKSALAKGPIRLGGAKAEMDPVSDPFLEQAFHRYQRAWRHWEEGKLPQAGTEVDEVLWLLSGVAPGLDPKQAEIREALQDRLSELIVLLNETQAGANTASNDSIELSGPLLLEMNEHVQREIDRFSTTQRLTFEQGYQLAGAYMSFIEKKLDDHGMPRELGWLPLIESGFKPHAESGAKALGLWQFMPATGTQYGLIRDHWVDRRLDPERSTEAAVVYLKYLYNTFGQDWNKALAAYNWGEGNVRKAIAKVKKPEGEVTFWDLLPRLPEETQRYVPKFLAAVTIAQDPELYGFIGLTGRKVPQRYEMVTLEKQMDMDVVAKEMGLEPKVLADLNPELRQRVTPPQKHHLRVPAGTGATLVAKLDQIPEYKPQPQVRPPKDMLIAKNRRRGGGNLVLAATARSKNGRVRRPSATTASRAKSKIQSGKKSVKTRAAGKAASGKASTKAKARSSKSKRSRNG